MSFASVDDLALHLRTDLSAEQRAQALVLLDRVTALIRSEADQVIDLVTDDVITLYASGTRLHLLPERPVTAVSSITETGNPTPLTLATHYDWSRDGILRRLAGTRWLRDITVTYSHGYAAPPADLRTICVNAAARAWRNPTGMTSEQMGSWSGRWATASAGLALTEAELVVVRGYRP